MATDGCGGQFVESLVPPIEWCQKIPDGEFSDSVFVRVDAPGFPVWRRHTKLFENAINNGVKMFPAPTMQEVINAIHEAGKELEITYFSNGTFHVDGEDSISYGGIYDEHPLLGVLDTWLQINRKAK